MSIVEASIDSWLPALWDGASVNVAEEIVETPRSWVVLTEHYAYKVKKPVQIGEADFRTASRRRQACMDDVSLNPRLAASVYRGVLPITRDFKGRLHVNGNGVAIDWTVKMRRLSEECSLARMIDAGKSIPAGKIAALANALATFYRGRPPESEKLDQLCTRLQQRVAESSMQLADRMPRRFLSRVTRIRDAQLEFLAGARMVLNLRVCDGRIVDGHGDLRLEHVYLERQPVVIGCIEYSARLRKIDALDDLGLFAMECERRERSDVAESVMSAYRRLTGDEGFPHLEEFYKSLHACTQAVRPAQDACTVKGRKVELSLDHAVAYLQQAEHSTQRFV